LGHFSGTPAVGTAAVTDVSTQAVAHEESFRPTIVAHVWWWSCKRLDGSA